MRKLKIKAGAPSIARQIWDAVSTNKLQLVLRLLITADANVNTTFEQAMSAATESTRSSLASLAGALSRKSFVSSSGRSNWSGPLLPSSNAPRPRSAMSTPMRSQELTEGPSSSEADLQGCNLLHIACQIGDLSLVELLLQHGAQVDAVDSLGRTALHHSVIHGKNPCAKLLLTRYEPSNRLMTNLGILYTSLLIIHWLVFSTTNVLITMQRIKTRCIR